MSRATALLALLIVAGLAACLGPYPDIGERLDVGSKVVGTSYVSVDGGWTRILILAPLDGGPAPYTRIDDTQPRAVETLQGTWAGAGEDAVTFSSTIVFNLPDEHTLPVSSRKGATRRELVPPQVAQATAAISGDVLDLTGAPAVAAHYRTLLGRTAQITGTDATASACAFHVAQLAVESSEARIPGFNSAGLTQYLNRVEPFDGILSGQVTVGLVGLFSPVVTTTFIGYADFEGVVLDGVQVSSTNGSGDGTLSGVLSFQIAREGLPPIDGQVDYREITLSGGNESGNYLITLDGGTQIRVPTGPWSPPLAQCLGF
ncbi:MAG TPA: hypothetical protein VMH40_03720 [Myxococcaceae bacterium]|nr:hypothetical protein [Myxococcaceae bacterium]